MMKVDKRNNGTANGDDEGGQKMTTHNNYTITTNKHTHTYIL